MDRIIHLSFDEMLSLGYTYDCAWQVDGWRLVSEPSTFDL